MTTETHRIEIQVDSTSATRASQNMSALEQATRRTESSIGAISSATKLLGATIGGLSFGAFAKSVFEVNKSMESLRTSLETVTGSAKNASIAFEGIQQFASKTPYSVKEITEAFIKMKALGLAPTEAALTSFGNTASAMGKSLKQMIEAVADATTGEMERLKEFGIKSSKDGDNFKMTFKGVETTVKNSSTEIIKYLEKIGNTDFAGGMDRQAKTMNGALSSLADSWDAFQDHILSGAAENSIARWVGNATAMLSRFDAWINGAFTKTGKLAELRNQQASSLEKIMASEKNGFFGRVADAVGEAVWGYSVENEKKKLAAISSQMESLKKEIADDEITKTTITSATPGQKSHEEVKKSHAAHSGLSEAQRELNHQQEEYKRLIESTPYGEYNAKVDELSNALKNNGINQSTYSTLLNEANARLLDSTDYLKENTKAIDEQTRAKELAFEATARGKFERGDADLRAKKPFMSESEYTQGQDKLVADYLTQQQGKDYKSPAEQAAEAAKELAKFTEESNKAIAALDSFGNSGKMAFDGILGGISAVAGAFSSLSDELSNLAKQQASEADAYKKFIDDAANSEADKAKATIKHKEYEAALSDKSFRAEISGARQIAGATSKLFGEKSAARKAFHAVEMGMSVIEMAMAAKKMVVDVAAGAANMFSQGGFAGFAGVAAMAAVMAGLGFAMSGSSKPAVDNTMKATSELGTVLGDKESQSNSIGNIVKTLNDIDAKQFPQLKELNDSFKKLESSLSGFVTTIAQRTDSFTNMIGGLEMPSGGKGNLLGAAGSLPALGLLGSLFGTKTTVTKLGEGFIFEFGNLFTQGAAGAITGKTFLKYQTTKKSLFGSKTSISEIYGQIDDEILSDMQRLFGYVGDSLLKAFDTMNATSALKSKIELFNLGTQKWDFSKAEDKEKYFNAMINATADRMASVSKVIFGQYQRLGEGMFETVGRLATQMTVVRSLYKKQGVELGEASIGLAGFSSTLVEMFNSTADAKDGLKNFIETMNDVYNLTHTEGEKTQYTVTSITDALTKPTANGKPAIFEQVTGTKFDASKIFNDEYMRETLATLTKLSGEASKEASDAATAAKKAAVFVEMYNAPEKSSGNTLLSAIKQNPVWVGVKGSNPATNVHRDWETRAGTSDLSKASWDTIIAAGQKDWWDNLFKINDASIQLLKTTLDANRETKAAGAAGGGSSMTLAESKAQSEAANLLVESTAATAAATLGLKDYFEGLLKDVSPKLQAIQDEYLKTTMSADEWKGVERDRIIKEKFKSFNENMRDYAEFSQITNAMIAEGFEGVTATGKITAEQMQRYIWKLEDTAKATKKLADASKYMTDFSNSISGWVSNQKVTQIGSTQTQLAAAGKAFDALMLRINLPNSIEDKKLAMSGITQSADAYMNSIKNFYGSSKAGQDLMQGVIDKVSVLPDSVNIQQMIYDKLEEIRAGVVAAPTFSGALSASSTSIINQLATDIKAAVDKNLTAPTLQNAQTLTANAQVMLTLQNISATTSSTDGVFLDKLIKSIGSNTGLLATIDATINSNLDPATKQSAIESLNNSFNAIQVDIKKFKASPTPENLAALQNDISLFGDLTASVNAKVTALNLNPNDSKLKADVQTSLDSMNAFSAKIGGLTLSQEAITAANAKIASDVKPEVIANVTFKDANPDSKAYLQSIKDVTETAAKGLEIKINTKVEGTALNTLNEQTVSAINNMTRLSTEINTVATKLGDKAMSTVMASTSGGTTPFDTSKLVVPVSLRDNLENSGAISYFDSSLTESQLAAGERIGGKLTSAQVTNYTKAMATIFKKGSNFNKNLSYVDAYNQSHPNNSISMDLMYTVLDDDSLKLGGRVAASTLPKTATVAQKASADKADYDAALAKYKDAESIMNNHKSMYASTIGFNAAHPNSQAFATGGAFTNGIVDHPTSFNMGLMGEAGSEAIMPLHNIGGSLGVRAVIPAANDSGNNEEEIAELKAQNRLLNEQNAILREGFLQLISENKTQNKSLNSIKVSAKERAYK